MDNKLEIENTDLQTLISEQAMEVINLRIENNALKRKLNEMNNQESAEE